MGTEIHGFTDLTGITDISSLYVNGSGNLVKHSAIGGLCHKIANAFRSLSESGRAEIARQTESLYGSFQEMVQRGSIANENQLAKVTVDSLKSQLDTAVASQREAFVNEKLPGLMKTHPALRELVLGDRANAEAFIRNGFKALCEKGLYKELGKGGLESAQWGPALGQLADMVQLRRTFEGQDPRENRYLKEDFQNMIAHPDVNPGSGHGVDAMLLKDGNSLSIDGEKLMAGNGWAGKALKGLASKFAWDDENAAELERFFSSLLSGPGLGVLANGRAAQSLLVDGGTFKTLGFVQSGSSENVSIAETGKDGNKKLAVSVRWKASYAKEGSRFDVEGETRFVVDPRSEHAVGKNATGRAINSPDCFVESNTISCTMIN